MFPFVTAYVSVTDREGQPITDLRRGEFIVSGEGKPVAIVELIGSAGVAVKTLLILDQSGSMVGPKLAGLHLAAASFVDLKRLQDWAGLLVFNGTPSLVRSSAVTKRAAPLD